ncbi:glycoside-pentoside-hexuronide (GPH):cation symporter [SAR86 cluster bacterium]|jgi:GPH family glycoside/pentoside/hexuronide:cation symporter|nr:glycoside-pentoside-hexuronide (GPH):cation symporter [SAR86 cluster bacterium]MEC7197147.1 glycoside-pentoside-hexuronide (GPH):cation symporter [Pseudomonadota bacterium]GIR51562.1 MAG: MFS transporter [Gammaproteobacteria bacterium]|tara:strand:- start:10 stop:1353 length:1344 start_codon:yes stop_codon:yes gene_type:complete
MNSETLTNRVRAGYGIGDYAICLYWSGIGLYLLYFYTDVVGISPILAGWIYALGIGWDAITDPFMGYLAERTKTKMGSYRPFIYYGSIPLALSFVLLFWVPPFEGTVLFLFLILVNLIHRSCFTIVSVPYSSLTARITNDSNERTKLTTARMISASFGTLSMSALAFPLIAYFGGADEAFGFLWLAIISGLIAIALLSVTVYSVREKVDEIVTSNLPNFVSITKTVATNYPFWIVFGCILILGSTGVMFNKNLIYFVKYGLELHEYQGLILGVSSGASFLSLPFWAYLALKIGKRETWLISMTIAFIGLLLFFYYPIASLNELLILLALIGVGNGAGGVLFWSMLPDTVEYGEWKSGIRTESSLYGFMTFAQKSSIAVAALILGFLLSGIGFEPNQIQSEETISGMKFMMSWIPICGIIISLVLMYFYPISTKFHGELLQRIKERNA